MIKNEIIIHFPLPKQGFPPTVALEKIANAIPYELKTGTQ